MQFNKLRILGFKSFVEPTEFLIEKGLTGVVGPNGCGKSNLVEAIKWVMGESSYKNMRASGMDDVIFSGSGNRPARNTAEVTLFLDNTNRTAPAAFNDSDQIEITRRIERESGSVYRINGKEARARDVQLLFADASTGARSSSMVGQGRIGELISAKPRQRRLILEEAAGISGLHTRRHEAELRLKATEQNLDRVEDVVTQIDGQLENLKRQARQANRYRNLSGDIRKNEAMVFHLRWIDASEAERKADAGLKETTAAVADATTLQAQTARDQAVIANSLPKLRDEASTKAAALQKLQLTQSTLEREEKRAKDRMAELARHIEQLDHDIARERELVSENDAILKRLSNEQDHLNADAEKSTASREEAEAKLKTAAEVQATSEEAYNQTTREIAELNAKRSTLENAVTNAERQIERIDQDLKKVQGEIASLDERLSQDLFINVHREALETATNAVIETEAAVQAAEAATQVARDSERQAQENANQLEKELSSLETEAKTLANILDDGTNGQWTSLIDEVSAEPGYELALAAALGDDLNAAIDKDAPVHWAGQTPQSDDPQLPEGIAALYDHVAAPAEVKRRLMQIGVVSEEPTHDVLEKMAVGQRIVTMNGGLWRWDGLVASSDAETPAAKRLAQKNRLAEVEGFAQDKQKQVATQRETLIATKEKLNQLIQEERSQRDTLRTKQTEQRNARDTLAKAESEMSRIAERRTAVEERQTRLKESFESANSALSKAKEERDAVPQSSALDDKLQEQQTKLSQDRAALAEARAVCETFARETKLRKDRLASIELERKNWLSRAEAAGKQIDILSERKSDASEESAALEDAPAEFQRNRVALFSKIKTAEEERTTSQNALSTAENELKEADEAAKSALLKLSESREGRVRAEERLETARVRKSDISRAINEALECSPGALPAILELKEGASLPDISAVEVKLERLKAERERLGGVNLRADIEIQEMTEKRDTLTAEREDLIEAIKQLRNAIASLNKEGRERLLAAFDEVNEHFKRLFTHLFGGGTAELQLTESEDPLEAGLDIMARPPGKKPQTMTLLSGGEQALTATALIFAVFLTNPSPICVLDEVDAPLDDANVERYCNLLDDMTEQTQTRFLTITHNPITMARMSRLFGVTMAERGVSQLVSVDLQTAESFREAG